MTYNNGKRIVSNKMRLIVATFPFVMVIALLFWPGVLPEWLTAGTRTAVAVPVTLLYIYFAVGPAILRHHYIYYSDDGDRIILRFYSAGFSRGMPRSIEIVKRDFRGYSVSTSFGGLIPSLILYEKRRGKVAKYPPVPLSAVQRKIRVKIYESLQLYTKEK